MYDEKSIGLKIKQLRSNHSLKIGRKYLQKDLADDLNISRSYIGDIESGRTIPSNALLSKISEKFSVPLEYLSSSNDVVCCPVCSFQYSPLDEEDYGEHEKFHNDFLNYVSNNEFLSYADREILKTKSRNILGNNKSSLNEKIVAANDLLKCFFYRDLELTRFSKEFPSLDNYVFKNLKEGKFTNDLPHDVYINLLEQYNIETSLKDNLIMNFNKLNSLGKEKLINYSNDLLQIHNYIENTTSFIKNNPKDYLMPVACHNDDLTEDEKSEMDRRIEEYMKNRK